MFRLQKSYHLIKILLIGVMIGILWTTCTQKSPLDPTLPIHEKSAMLVDMAASPKTIGIGAYSLIRIRLLDEEGAPIVNNYVSFSATSGTITDSSRTDTAGYAQAIFRSSETAGTATITATYNKTIVSSIQIEIVEEPDVSLTVQIHKHSLLANGTDSTQVTVYLVGDSVATVEADLVNLYSSDGSLSYTGSSRFVDGKASMLLTSPSSVTDISGVVTATFEEYTAIDTIKFKGINFQLTASPNQILADGESASRILAIVKETSSQVAIPGQTISFGTNLGLIAASGTTDLRGVAEVSLTSSTSAGQAEVIATYGATMTRRTSVEFLPKSGALYVIQNVTANPTSILANGVNTSTVSTLVLDKQNRPVLNDSIHFETNRGRISPAWVKTNASGVAQATLIAASSDADSVAHVRVSRGNDIQSLTTEVNLLGIQMELAADPPAIIADGKSQSAISVVLKQSTNKIAISNAEVTFSSNFGLIASSGTTDITGQLSTKLTSSKTVQTARVIASYGQYADTVEVPFLPEGQNLYTISNISTSSYRILANGEEQTQIDVTVVDSDGNPATGDTIRFESTVGAFDRSYNITNSFGIASVSFIPKASTQDSTATITATRAGGLVRKNLDRTIQLVGVRMDLNAVPNAILANGESQSRIIVVLKENLSQVAIQGAQVQFAAGEGLIPNTATTDASGRAEVALTSSLNPTTTTVTARYGQINRATSVSFLASSPEHLVVTVTPPVIPADGKTASTITAVVTDFSNNPVPGGIPVTFTKLSGPSINFINQKVTGADGTASTSLTALSIGAAVIEVAVAALRETVTVECTEGPVGQVTLVCDKEEIHADAIETATLTATVRDAQGFPLAGKLVQFSATIGNITQSAVTDANGAAGAKFSSGQVGISVVTASVQKSATESISADRSIKLTAGGPFSVNLDFNPKEMGVKETGQNQTVEVTATVRDGKNNIVDDSTLVRFSIIRDPNSPRHPDISLYSTDPIPTVAGSARVSCSSGRVSGAARIRAEVLQQNGAPYNPPIQATSTQLVVHAGPPYIEDINDVRTSHLTIATARHNICALTLDTTVVTVILGDRYNNPIEVGTSVYLTTSGGVLTTRSYTSKVGVKNDTIFAAQPYPTVNRFYCYEGLQDPNLGTPVPAPSYPLWYGGIIDFDGGDVDNVPDESYPACAYGIPRGEQNNGIARLIAYSEGMDQDGNPAKAWNWTSVVFSTGIARFDENSLEVIAEDGNIIYYQGRQKDITVTIWDTNGNPIASGSKITATVVPAGIQAKVEPAEIVTDKGMGQVHYRFSLGNEIDPEQPKPGSVKVKFTVESDNGSTFHSTEGQFYISDQTAP